MYMNRNEAEVTLGRGDEFEAMVDQWATVQQPNAGFVGGTLLQAYGNPGRYTLFSRWTDRDASIAAGRREQFKSFARDFLASGVARPTRLTEAFESVFEVDQENVTNRNAGTAERWVDFTLTVPMVAPAFEESMRRLAELSKQHAPGVLSVRLRRSMGSDTKYLLLVITTDLAASRGWLLVPEVRAHAEATPLNQYLASSPQGEIHHVVKRYAGPALAAAQPPVAAARST